LRRDGVLSRKISFPIDVLPSAAIRHILVIINRMAVELENMHPRTFCNISLVVPEVAPVVVENIGRTLFKHNDVTWGKIISFMAVSAAIACDCVKVGSVEIIQSIVDQTFAVLADEAGSWIDKEGGFNALTEHIRPIGSEHITFLGWLTMLTGFLLTVHWLILMVNAISRQLSNIL
jgi:Apoptosis regulator proteins, Bcl-2 family